MGVEEEVMGGMFEVGGTEAGRAFSLALGQIRRPSDFVRTWLGNYLHNLATTTTFKSVDVTSRAQFDAVELELLLTIQISTDEGFTRTEYIGRRRDQPRD